MTTSAAAPSRAQRVVDSLLTRLQRLPPATTGYTITRDLRVPMRDGVELLTDMYVPNGTSRGTILVRSPYGFALPFAALQGGLFASRGYRVLLSKCRGTFGSGGEFMAMIHEVDDGADTVAWMREQPWFDGRFATYGGSYLGFTQWALLVDPPPELVTAVILVGPHDFHAAVQPGGAFALMDFLGWSKLYADPAEVGGLAMVRQTALSMVLLRRTERALRRSADVSLLEVGARELGGGAPWYREWVTRDADDPWWAPMRCGAALDRVNVPVLLHTGWQDLFHRQSFEQFERLAGRSVDVAMTVGPWNHGQAGTKGGAMLAAETLDWFAEHLDGTGGRTRPSAVKAYVTGAEEWRDLPTWPPATRPVPFRPQPGGRLADDSAPEGATATFEYDPSDPTPSVGGASLSGGYKDDTALAERADVLTFTSEPLGVPVEVMGAPELDLVHHSSTAHGDVFVRVSQVDAKGASRNVSDGFVRLDPDTIDGTVRIVLDPVAHRFDAGTRIRLLISGGAYPRWERNLGTGADPATSTNATRSTRTIDLHDCELRLPVTS